MSNNIPDNIAVMVRISLLHLSWGLLISIFESWTSDNDVSTRRLRRESDGQHILAVQAGILPSPSQEKSSSVCDQWPLYSRVAHARA